jgi:predicted nuclease of predicted toxin-antitoxin system
MSDFAGYYFDEHLNRIVAKTLVARGIQVVMAVDVSMRGADDDHDHLPYATQHKLVLVTFDRPFAGRTQSRTDHPGLICLSEAIRNQIGRIVQILEDFAALYDVAKDHGQVFWLP